MNNLRRAFYTPIFAYFSQEIYKLKNYKPIYLQSNDKPKLDTVNSHLQNELKFHIKNFEHYLEHLIQKEKIIFKFENDNENDQVHIQKAFSNYKMNKHVKKLYKEIKKIDRNLKNYLNLLESNINRNNFFIDLDFNLIIEEIKKIQMLKKSLDSKPSEVEKSSKNINTLFRNFIFNEHDEVIMRLLSQLIIFNKKSNSEKISKDNLDFVIDYCKEKIKDVSHLNESHLYYAKRILINLMTKKDYFYQDYILEINHKENLKEFNTNKIGFNCNDMKIKDDEYFDYDIVFLSGLNANFSKSWRVPEEELMNNLNIKHHLDFLFFGKHTERIFAVPSYKLWIPKMFESVTFADKKIRFMVTCAETKIFPHDLDKFNIPDFSLDQISEQIYNSFKHAGIGKRPLIFVCHSMGGLICKKVLTLAKEEGYLINNVKGVLFFSTPHFGSSIIHTLLDVGIRKYLKLFKVFETTSTEYGLDDEDIHSKLIELKFTRATTDICSTPKDVFEKQHQAFRILGLKYICLNETQKTYLKAFRKAVHIVEPESSHLPEVQNYLLKNKLHSNLQKFSPDDFEEEGYNLLVNFIKTNFNFI